MKMNDKYPEYISEKRRPTPSPADLVGKNGQAVFGTFDEPLKAMSLIDCKKPCGKNMPDFMKKNRLTIWEAFEVNMDEGSLLSAVYNMGVVGFSIFVWHDKKENKIYSWMNIASGKKCIVAPTLIDTKTTLKTKKSFLLIDNYFDKGICNARGNSSGKAGGIEFNMKAKRLSPPSIVSIPFGANKPLYSEKDFFAAEGNVKINGNTYLSNERTTVIVDDHKGYYPFKAHYDWLTTMGKTEIDGEQKYLAINFTRNQSVNQDDYNENLLWLEGVSCPIPPVYFEHIDKNTWHVKDDYGTVDVTFRIANDFEIMHHLGLIDMTYSLPFGVLQGYVIGIDGKKYTVDGMTGIGEDKSTRI